MLKKLPGLSPLPARVRSRGVRGVMEKERVAEGEETKDHYSDSVLIYGNYIILLLDNEMMLQYTTD